MRLNKRQQEHLAKLRNLEEQNELIFKESLKTEASKVENKTQVYLNKRRKFREIKQKSIRKGTKNILKSKSETETQLAKIKILFEN